MASCTATFWAARCSDTTQVSWGVLSPSWRIVSAVMRRNCPPKNRSKSSCHFVTRFAGATTSTRLARPSRCASRSHIPAMIVLPVPGSSASRNRSTGWGSIDPYTASVWCG